MTINPAKKSALDKLEKLGLTQEEALSLFDEEVEKPTEPTERKSWQQLVMEEHLGYYNERYGTSYSFEEYYDNVVNERIDIHYDWKQLLGMKDD